MMEYCIAEQEELASNEDGMELSQCLIAKNMETDKVLAKL